MGALAARFWFAYVPQAFATGVAQPLPVVTAWGSYGGVGFAMLAIAIAASTLVVALAARARRANTAVVVAFAAATLAANLAWPATFSSDVYAYAAYGDLAARGIDPYLIAPAALHDAFLDDARFQWSGPFPVCVYGPAFVAFARTAFAAGAPHGVAATLLLLRVAACVAFLGSIALLGLALRDQTAQRRTLALYAYGLNPVALWSVAEGHNDAFLLLAASASFAFARRRSASLGSVALALGPLIKAPGVLFALVYALRVSWFEPQRARRTWLGAACGTIVAALFTLPPLLPALTRLGKHGVYAPTVSIQGLIGPIFASLVAAALLANAVRLLARRDPRAFAWAGLAIVVALPNDYPWYALWLLPLVLAAGSGRAAAALWGATIFALVRYLPDATGNMSDTMARAASAVAALPFALAFADLRHSDRRKTTPPS